MENVRTGATGTPYIDLSEVKQDIIANEDAIYNLGSEDKRWLAIYAILAILTSAIIGGVYLTSTTEGWFYINASTYVNGSLNASGNISAEGFYLDNGTDCCAVDGADTHVAGDGVYLYNDSTTMYFNDSLLNTTINNSGLFVRKTGDTMTGDLEMGNYNINISGQIFNFFSGPCFGYEAINDIDDYGSFSCVDLRPYNNSAELDNYYNMSEVDTLGNWSDDKSSYSTITDRDTLGNWSDDQGSYYTSAEVDSLNGTWQDNSDNLTGADVIAMVGNFSDYTDVDSNLTGDDVIEMVGNYSDWDKDYADLINPPTNASWDISEIPVGGNLTMGNWGIVDVGIIYQNANYYHCFDMACVTYIFSDGTSLFIKVN